MSAAPTITSERRLLTVHLEWIAAQPWVDEFYAELRELLASLKSLNGTQDDRPVGRCYLPSDEGACGGPIWVDTTAGHAHCGRCRQTWDGYQLALLNYELERARRPKDERGEPLWSAQEIAAEHDVKPGTVPVWAHRRGITSVKGYYDPRQFRDKATA